ncbi:MAG: FKBP-type peptidyl-prolyl cis-trans isomerase [Hyphomicrobiales bacterium]|nr:FKBP-type peptidyl-prolyl cis-trans isomerase [Hyphomicrobiales bacterium]
MRRLSALTAAILATALIGGCSSGTTSQSVAEPVNSAAVPTPNLQMIDNVVGTGASPKLGATMVMHYTGWIYENGVKGQKFDSSLDRGEPFEFQIGMGKVIAGWDKGIASMKVGGKRTLIIPPELGYGATGAGNLIPPNATLIFEVELLDVKA